MLKYIAFTMGLCAHILVYANDSVYELSPFEVSSSQIHLSVTNVDETTKQESQGRSSNAIYFHKRSSAVDQTELETLSQTILDIIEKKDTDSEQKNFYNISTIQRQLIINGLEPNDLEGGYVLLFDSQGNLKNSDKVCSLRCILSGIQYGSPDAYLVLALTNQVHGASYLAFQHFLIAASGNNGLANSDSGGTSSELAFYTMHKILRERKIEGIDNESIEQQLKKYSYKGFFAQRRENFDDLAKTRAISCFSCQN